MRLNFSYPVATLAIIAICVVWALISGIGFTFSEPAKIIEEGGNFAPLTLGNDPWRLISSLFVHAGFVHLLLNMLALFTLGRAVEPALGHIRFLILFLICGVAGNLLSLYWNLFTVSAGASGAIFGIFGFDMILTVARMRHMKSEIWRTVLTAVIYVSLILLIGIIFPFDNAAHLGGLFCGIFFGILFTFLPNINISAVSVAAVLFMISVYIILPRFQVIHYKQFHGLMETEQKSNELSAAFKTDEQALEGFIRIRTAYDSMASLFADSLEQAPASVLSDRLALKNIAEKMRNVSGYKIHLLREKSYRYLDSIEIAQSRPQTPLIHPLMLESSPEEPETPASPGKLTKAWYDEDWREIDNIRNAKYYRIGYKDSLGNWNGRVEDYYLDGGIQMKGYYAAGIRDGVFRYYSADSTYTACGEYDRELRTGYWEFFHENGQLSEVRRFADNNYLISAWDEQGRSVVEDGTGETVTYYSNGEIKSLVPYRDGLAHGTAFGNYGNGTLKYQEFYEKGELVRGRSFKDNATNTYDVSTFFPFPVGGMEHFNEYAEGRTASLNKGPGRVRLLFTCPPNGEIYDIRVLEGASPELDRLAIKILAEGPAWNPAREHGLDPYTSEGVVTITFK